MRYTTFHRVHTIRWASVLKFRQRTLFSQCEVCHKHRHALSDKTKSMEAKLAALTEYRKHLHNQFCDRTILWTLHTESADFNTDVLVISIDGLDQAKFALPRDAQLRPSASL